MRTKGRRYDKQRIVFSTKKKITAILLIVVLIIVLMIEASLSFFSDVIINGTNTILGAVDITMSDVLIDDEVSTWTLGDVNNFEWTITNTGRSAVRLTNTLRIGWETPGLNVGNVVFVYPKTMSDDEVRYDIENNNGEGAIISQIDRN